MEASFFGVAGIIMSILGVTFFYFAKDIASYFNRSAH